MVEGSAGRGVEVAEATEEEVVVAGEVMGRVAVLAVAVLVAAPTV